MVIYTAQEYKDMLKIYHKADENAKLAANLYAARYSHRKFKPSPRNFERLVKRFDAYSSTKVIEFL